MQDTPAPPTVAGREPTRREWLGAAAGAGLLAGCALPTSLPLPGFLRPAPTVPAAGIAPSTSDRVTVADGHAAAVLARWGDPVGLAGSAPAWRADGGHGAAEQALQIGQQIAGVQFLALDGSRRGVLVLGHDAPDEGALHTDGGRSATAEQVRKSQAAVGLSVVEATLQDGVWGLQPSAAARRITAATSVAFSGPAAGHALLRTAGDTAGRRSLGVLGTGTPALTPWGTCLAGESDWAGFFTSADQPTRTERRYGLGASSPARWAAHDTRFDTVRHPNEPHRFGWVVEFDPLNAKTLPVKRTALGRAAWGAIAVALLPDRRAVVYLGDAAPGEPLARFVSRVPMRGGGAAANATLLDDGVLQVARFDAGGSGRWLTLAQGAGPLVAANGFADAGEALVKLRLAAELLKPTPLDGAWSIAVDPASGWVHLALASRPGSGLGPLLRWREQRDAERFDWTAVTPTGDAFAAPASLSVAPSGQVWLGTGRIDLGPGRDDAARLGNNALLRLDPARPDARRFLVGPVNAAISGHCTTDDGRTLFVAVKHPGRPPGERGKARTDPDAPRRYSNWPDFNPIGRPRSAVLAVRRIDGGVVGS